MAAESILVNGVTEILKPLISLVSQRITSAWGVKDDLRKLMETLASIQALITSAEEKQVNDPTVRLWMRNLKDVVYDADDVMDEFIYETMRPIKMARKILVSSSNPLVVKFKMARKIRAINERLDKINKDSKTYQLQNITQNNPTVVLQSNRLTSSVGGTDSLFLGREAAKSDIIKILIGKPSTSSSGISYQPQNVSTLSIVGMGGMGKTTLAQMVYNDNSVERNFELRAWVCVSHPFHIFKILKDVNESITGSKCEDLSNVDVLAKQVKEKLIGKKYLLVLDDLWNENVTYWEKLKNYLSYGGIGSKILVTTRSQTVASVVGGDARDLEKLSNDVCWSIIEKKVLSQGGAVLTDPEMISIGKDIAKKCDGVPLAANLLGSSMCLKREKSYWRSIVDDIDRLRGTSEYDHVISILKLSYDNLSPPLKQCFSYCCIFPKDWEINREMLIRLWMAEGFVFPSGGGENISLEDIGNEYFECSLWSSFFQDVEKDEESGDITTCKMHDLVHDLATSVLDPNEFRISNVRDEKEDVRRLQLQFDEGQSLASPKVLSNAVKLRTIVALNPKNILHINSFFQCRRLRVLCRLSNRYQWEVPSSRMSCLVLRELCSASSISKLKHLRYLDLSNLDLSPEVSLSLSHSYNLQTLILRGCRNVPSCLFNKIGSLKSLRHLDFSHSDIKSIPENIGSFEHLSFLDVSRTPISKIPDSITRISSLKTLKFDSCRNLVGLPSQLGALTRLSCLDLSGTNIKVLPESCISNLCNLEIMKLGRECERPKEIKNWPKLRIFTHERFYDVMPRGIERLTCLETLYYVARQETEVCGSPSNKRCSGIEDLAGLNSLRELWIIKLENVRGGIEDAETAKLKDKQHLRELNLYWGSTDDDQVPRSVNDTAVLEGLQPHSNLKTLDINGFSGLKLPKWMMGCSLSNYLPDLAKIDFTDFNNCEQLPSLGMLPFLRDLSIWSMKSIKCLGEEFYYQQENREEEESSSTAKRSCSLLFPWLVDLWIIDLENLEEWVAPPLSSTSSCFPSLETMTIRNCKRLRSTPPITSFSSLKRLELWGINDNAVNSLLNIGGEGCLPSLTSFEIWDSPDQIYLPPFGALLQHSTQSLKITHCSNFQGFRDDGDNRNNNNSSIRSLWLQYCPVLTSLPDLRLCTSLRELRINNCDKLKNKESIPYDLKKSLAFLDVLKVDFIQRDEGGPDVSNVFELTNLMEKKK
ncbi:disease resistance protein RGA2-like [Papaver somniferum]|uniref:disease resistance protein RGA2-like n=1 Tax=Papaver somniferum TaxID=3469 RepID=UPI000E6FA9DE|nr:disease resistance protein RGA2-like [Papaver somniferum]